MKKNLRKLVLSALFICMGLVLPFVTGQLQNIGNMLLPMHMPVLLCGLVCGWQYGLGVGLVTPLLRSFLFSKPPMYPNAVIMALELCTYGAVIGIMYALSKNKDLKSVYVSMLVSMVSGRAVWAVAKTFFFGIAGKPFTFEMFLSGALLEAIPGICLQLVVIPAVMSAINKMMNQYTKQ